MGYGATPHRIKDARGADGPRLFLEKKEGKKNKPKTSFSAGKLRGFAKKYSFLAGNKPLSKNFTYP